MLNFFRIHAKSWIIKVLLILIAVAFVWWGGSSLKSVQSTTVARVDNHDITHEEYTRQYSFLVDSYRRQFGSIITEDFLNQLNLKEQALNLIIKRYVVLKAARELGLTATDDDVRQAVLKNAGFRKDGKFDQETYTRVLRQFRMTPQEYENQLADSVTLQNVEAFVKRRVVVSDEEARAYFQFNNTQYQLAYVQFDPKGYEQQVSVDDAAVQAYYTEHQDQYRDPEKRQFSIVVFKTDAYLEGLSVPDEEAAAYYEDHKDKYHQDAQVHARHILFRIAEGASEEEVDKVRDKARQVLEEAKKPGADFGTLAIRYSEDPGSAQKGGDLGFFSRDRMVPAFAEAAFSLQPGQMSDLVRTQFGFHVIKVEEARPEKTTPLEEVRNEIVTAIKRDKAREIAYNHARDFADQARAERDIKKAAGEAKLQVIGADKWVSMREPLPEMGFDPTAMKELFALSEKTVSGAIENPQGLLVAQVEAIQASRIPPLDQVKERVQKDVKAQEAHKLAQQKAAEFLDLVRQQTSIQNTAREKGMEVVTTEWFTREKPDQKLKLDEEGMQQVLQLDTGNPFPKTPLEVSGRSVVCRLEGKKAPEGEAVEKALSTVRKQLTEEKQNQVWDAWLTEAQKKARIERLQQL